jgi:DNA polymerase III delta prime subunit
MQMDIHENINTKLEHFLTIQKIPNMLFHGPHGAGKKTLVWNFIQKMYCHNKDSIKNFVMSVNCAHGKGIKFIREELKLFAKTNIFNAHGVNFKTILLYNADNLTTDAQSALRRCIELFSHSSRFFMIVENKYKLLRPILSRFCELYIPLPTIHNTLTNLHLMHIHENSMVKTIEQQRKTWIQKTLFSLDYENIKHDTIVKLASKMYEKGISAMDIVSFIEEQNIKNLPWPHVTESYKYEWIMCFHKVRTEIRCEQMVLYFILHFLYLPREISKLENISFL